MDEVEQRLKDTTAQCIKCYEAWIKDKKSEEARENLAEAIHELRKVSSRLEIDMAASEREQMTGRPISIPPHRSQRKVHAAEGNAMPFGDEEDDDDVGNAMPDSNEGNGLQPRRSGGGGGKRPQQNRGRRPNPNRGNE